MRSSCRNLGNLWRRISGFLLRKLFLQGGMKNALSPLPQERFEMNLEVLP